MVLTIPGRETLYVARSEVPGVVSLADHASVLAVDLKSFVPVHAHGYGEVEVADAAISELRLSEPAAGAEFLHEPGAYAHYLPAQEADGVKEVAAVRQHVVTSPVRPGFALWSPGLFAGQGDRLQGVGHRVTVERVAVPGFEREHLPHLLPDKAVREGDAGVEALLGADLEHEPRSQNSLAQVLALLHAHAHGLLHEHVLAGLDGLSSSGHVELVRHPDDHRLDARVGEHGSVVGVRNPRGMDGGHLLEKILRDVADSV